jgi:2-oxoglutarate dehydrogenase E2 component (dihydrolipoamide succinyltransferase)
MADVTLPQLGETVTEGTITQWFKQVGDTVAADEPLFEVSTDKVDTEVPSPIAGVVSEIRVAEGETVDVGTVIAVIGEQGAAPADAAPAAPAPEAAPTPTAETPASADETPAAAPVAAAPPAPEPADQPAAEPAEKPADEPAKEPAAEPADEPAKEPADEPAAEMAAPSPPAPAAADAQPPAPADGRLLSPVVRRLVNEHGIDPGKIDGTGPGGRITREDVLDYIDASGGRPEAPAPAPAAAAPSDAPTPAALVEPAPAAPAPPAATVPAAAAPARPAPAPRVAGERDTSVKLSKIRRLTGDHMVMSKATSPHAFSVVEVDFAKVDVTRTKLRGDWKASEGFSLTYLPFISRAIIDGLSEFPHLNASVADDSLLVHNYIDLGIAVDLGYEGLLAPVIRDAETKRLRAIAREISDLANRAKTRKLSPDEIQGGTFTISNNGSAGSVLTMPIINQPQVAIISTDSIVRKPVAISLPDGAEAIVVHPVGNLAMSWDHRAFDGAYAAGFLKRVKEILEIRDWDAEV